MINHYVQNRILSSARFIQGVVMRLKLRNLKNLFIFTILQLKYKVNTKYQFNHRKLIYFVTYVTKLG